MEDKRDKIGKIATDLLQKEPETYDPIEYERAMHEDYEEELINCILAHEKVFTGDFYVVVITKKERLLQNVIRNFFFARQSCPTPEYDQAVYRYTRADDVVDFLWVIPSKDTVELLHNNALQVPPEERELLQFVLDFQDGTLLNLAKSLNGERKESNILETR
jgi:hypothetical protein